jgi:hypothetical protein
LQDRAAEAGLSDEALGQLAEFGRHTAGLSGDVDAAQMGAMVDAIPDPVLKGTVMDSIAEVTRQAAEAGYGGLYWTAAAIGVALSLVAVFLIPLRRKSPAPTVEHSPVS